MQSSIFRPLWIVTATFLATIFIGLGLSAWLSLRERERLNDAEGRLERTNAFEQMHVVVERRLLAIAEERDDDPALRQQMAEQMRQLTILSIHPDTPAKLEAVRDRLERTGPIQQVELVRTMALFNDALWGEHRGRAALVAKLQESNEIQLRLEFGVLLAMVAIAFVLLPIARRRILNPLNAFGRQLARVSGGDLRPVPIEAVEPFMMPLHVRFNDLIRRLNELEAAHQARTASLESEVRSATRVLLDQQRSLARAERLAATGEFAASVAHELRNPLAGIQMTLTNLRGELHDAELVERLDLVLNEVGRLTRLLNELLDSARHAPEPARPIQLVAMADDLLALTRCQLAPEIRLEHRIDPALTVRLPADHLRQALLNLILNAGGALAGQAGTITVSAAVASDRLRISVADDGPGFPPDILERGIRSFSSTRERGTGLGLALVRRFARDLGGEVELSNCQPHGAQATIVLPVTAD